MVQGPKTVLNLVDELSPVNFGIWHAAIATAEALKTNHGIDTLLVFPETDFKVPAADFPFVNFIPIKDTKTRFSRDFFSQWDPTQTIVASHGCWQYPTRWASEAKKLGFRWVYTPHGMLEPWSMSQKRLKKLAYFNLIEKSLAKRADWIRAVGSPEQANLKRWFPNTILIPNGIYKKEVLALMEKKAPKRILFLARLHHKKGVLPMVEAWHKSILWKSPDFELTIAGTDDGEQPALENFLSKHPQGNIRFLGPIFGKEKNSWLMNSHFYILPSLSEGFPTSVLEAMAAGLVAIITKGCNFPEALENGMAIETKPTLSDLISTFNGLPEISDVELLDRAQSSQKWVQQHYLWDKIAAIQADLYFQKSAQYRN
jgi:glycosyltransferase involved in cell wall biosynthesis